MNSKFVLYKINVILFHNANFDVMIVTSRCHEWGPIYYEASIIAQGIPELSFIRGSTLGTRAAEHKGCNWGMQMIDGCSLELCVATLSVASSGIAPQKYTQFNCMTLS